MPNTSIRAKHRFADASVAVVTHARRESYFLEIWTNHYSDVFGAENLHLLKHGTDWSNPAEPQIGTITQVEFIGGRKDRDAQMAQKLSAYCNRLLESHDFVIRVDCDEILAPDPKHGTWQTVFEECREHGYIYSLGLDIAHHTDREGAFDPNRPILDQRRHARVTGEYCKPNVISEPVTWTSACHEVEGKPVRLSKALILFHLASFDRDLLIARQAQRGDLGDPTYAGHEIKKIRQLERIKEFELHAYDDARGELRQKITLGDYGRDKDSPRFRKVFGRRWAAIELPPRFADLIDLKATERVALPAADEASMPEPAAKDQSPAGEAPKTRSPTPDAPPQPSVFVTPRLQVVRCEIMGEPILFCVDNPKDAIQKHHLAGQFYETEELDLIRQHFPMGGRFCDIGCNVGNHTVYAAKFFRASDIVMFEPNPLCIEILRANIALNEIGDVCDASFLGTGLSDGTHDQGRLVPDKPNNLGGTAISEDGGDIPLARGDDLLRGRDFDMIKIDVEGLEMKVLAGITGILAESNAKIFIEVDTGNDDAFHHWREENRYSVVARHKRYRQNTNYLLAR